MHWLSWEKLSLFEKDGGLGFKKIKDFNKALVAKKMWRLIQMDNIVVAQILEAKYLPNTLPLYAKKHFRPSYSWSSIFLARDLQLDGTL